MPRQKGYVGQRKRRGTLKWFARVQGDGQDKTRFADNEDEAKRLLAELLAEAPQQPITASTTNAPPLVYTEDRFSSYNVAEILLFAKCPHWSYERELRMLHNIEHADINLGPDQGGHNIYLFKFLPETVKEIILGCQMPEDKKQELITVAREKYPEASN
jgi:hypothetical protein